MDYFLMFHFYCNVSQMVAQDSGELKGVLILALEESWLESYKHVETGASLVAYKGIPDVSHGAVSFRALVFVM